MIEYLAQHRQANPSPEMDVANRNGIKRNKKPLHYAIDTACKSGKNPLITRIVHSRIKESQTGGHAPNGDRFIHAGSAKSLRIAAAVFATSNRKNPMNMGDRQRKYHTCNASVKHCFTKGGSA
jgi:hypothetical protein